MNKIINNFLKLNYQESNLLKLKQDASSRDYYRIENSKGSFILMDSKKEKKQFDNYLNIYNILKNVKISIPKIIECDKKNHLILMEDFGDQRFDKLIHDSKHSKKLMEIAIISLISIKKSISKNKKFNLKTYSFKNLKKEVVEFIDWYYPFVWNKEISLADKNAFLEIWKETYCKINFDFSSFVHGDFFCNNLIYLPKRNIKHQCGILDYQDALWGDDSLDIVSLFEDSRRIIKSNFRNDLINYYLKETNQINSKDNFKIKMNFLGAARQTRILGRWIKLLKIKKKKDYIKYIDFTWHWLENNLKIDQFSDLRNIINDLIPHNKRKYDN
ncbi:MAG: hypothetical protein CMI95_01400 [Pelagibacteraceae bacterium]|nr:hypothetical protein [Pelagibacteraceae bacterium]PPR52153.1 MAG: hypothetical protein CFH20_00058 [Alphaproteobacteria bacterium MarineAlpha5_Bin10]|tara:strand:+ start:1280 stop:2266 length:987 start_codon:yes stop_codon:yes gene_type:complete